MNRFQVIIVLLFFSIVTNGQTDEDTRVIMQERFCAGTIVSVSEDIGCYRLKGNKTGGMYGYCLIDDSYTPHFSSKSKTWSNDGIQEKIINSNCYTIIAPCFDYAQPFSEGWAAVCKDGKWAYISKDGDFLCDYKLDAAYPFKNGRAKIRYNGTEIEIDNKGKGLAREVLVHLQERKIEIISLTVNQLVYEGQYEKAIELGNKHLADLLPKGKLYDIPKQNILPIIRLIFATNGAKNQLMAMFSGRKPDLFNYYKSLETQRAFSYLKDSPILRQYDFANYYNKVKNNINNIELQHQIERADYKYAAVKFEREFLGNSQKTITPDLRYLYYMILALSGDFESVNKNTFLLEEESKQLHFTEDYEQAAFLGELKQYNSAVSLFLKVAHNNENTILGGKCYHHIALIYDDLGMKDEATNYYQKSIATYDQVNAPIDLKLDAMAELLSDSLLKSSMQYSSLFKRYKDEEIAFGIDLFSNLDTYTLNKQWGLCLFRINKVLSSLVSKDGLEANYADAYELTIFEKCILQDAQSTWLQDANSSKSESLQLKLDKYSDLRRDFLGIDIFDLDNDSIYNVIQPLFDIEREIKKELYGNSTIISCSKYNCYKKIQNSLQDNEAAIEFFTFTNNCQNEQYGAWIIVNGKSRPVFKYIMDVDECSNYTTHFRYNKDKETINKLFDSGFGTLVWESFNNIALYKTIYFAPVGVMGEIGIENLPFCSDPIGFIKKTHRLTSTSIIPVLKENSKNNLSTANLFGGLYYGKSFTAFDRGASHSGYLKWSRMEVDEIFNTLSNTCSVLKYVEKEGKKDVLQNYEDNSPKIIHIATHGWQKEKPFNMTSFMYQDRFNYYRQNTDLENEDWLLNTSGLCMSSNDNLTDSIGNILFASDLAKTKLSNTSLVVLSACNTIAGSNASGYSCTLGLNYALERANVRNIISSLWNVNDQKTYEFMTMFYRQLVSCKDVYDAFKQSVVNIRNKYPNNPEIWSSFILIEN